MIGWVVLGVVGCAKPGVEVAEDPPDPLPDPRFPADWGPDELDVPPTGSFPAPRLTLLTEAGPLTVDLRDSTGRPIEAVAAVAWDEDGDGSEELYLSAEEARYRFDPDTLTLTDPVPWVDDQGVPWIPDALASGGVANMPVLVGSRGSELRVWDSKTGTFASSAPMLLVAEPEVEPVAFFARSLSILHLTGPLQGDLLGIDPDGGVHLDTAPLTFVPFLVPPALCDGGALSPQGVVLSYLDEPFGRIDETMWLIADGLVHLVSGTLDCFEDAQTVYDDRWEEVAVRFGVGVDLDGDSIDTVVWGHR